MRRGAAFVATRNGDGAVLLVKRPDKGLLGGMAGVPTTAWTVRADGETGIDAAPFPARWQAASEIVHVFTHFELRLSVFHATVAGASPPAGSWWSLPSALSGEALPSVMKKAIAAALPDAFRA